MSEEKDSATPSSQPLIDKDPWLELLITGVEGAEKAEGYTDEERSIQITLSFGGLLISGWLISRDRYFEDVPIMKSMREKVESKYPPATEKEVPVQGRDFIHLRDARFIESGRTIPTQGRGIHWRGRLDRVDGFMIGALVYKLAGEQEEDE
ncbi:MAG: hypothetical protein WCF57_20335 [Pyrinomonadaceae bacterium]